MRPACLWRMDSRNVTNIVTHNGRFFIRKLWHLFVRCRTYVTNHKLSTQKKAMTCDLSWLPFEIWGRYHGGWRPSSDDSPATIPPSALNKPSITKRYHRRRTWSHTSPRRSPTMVTLHETRFVECRWWNGGWTVVIWRSSTSMIPAPDSEGCCFFGNVIAREH